MFASFSLCYLFLDAFFFFSFLNLDSLGTGSMQECAECLVILLFVLKRVSSNLSSGAAFSPLLVLFPSLKVQRQSLYSLSLFPYPLIFCHAPRHNNSQVNMQHTHWSAHTTFINHVGKLTPLCLSFYSFQMLSTLFVLPFVYHLLSLSLSLLFIFL